jgi:DNA repair exonuclease SbcCD nuclease subunit
MILNNTHPETVALFKKLKKAAAFTDIHFGKKGNSDQHNQDCLDSITWFCEQVRKDPTIDHIVVPGDWHELRSSLSINTMDYSLRGAELLSTLGIPIIITIGNHDLFHRDSRTMYSTIMFKHIPNIYLVPEPVVMELKHGPTLFAPFLFSDEYPGLVKHAAVPVWWGHFEFKGFVISGYNTKMEHGPEHGDFSGPKRIFSGHFHKRQIQDNIVYIGNAFPMDFSDAGDFARGMAVYDYKHDELEFIDWPGCPKYVKAKLSQFLDETAAIPANSRVRCIIDVPLTYEESIIIKQTFLVQYELRELRLEESDELTDVLTNTETGEIMENPEGRLNTVDELVVQMLGAIDTPKIDQAMLVNLYQKLQSEG